MKISDQAGIISIAGIMGGSSTGCSAETVNVLLESAYWDPITIAKDGRAMTQRQKKLEEENISELK